MTNHFGWVVNWMGVNIFNLVNIWSTDYVHRSFHNYVMKEAEFFPKFAAYEEVDRKHAHRPHHGSLASVTSEKDSVVPNNCFQMKFV